jgi:PAS domain S-box-containing protein
MTDPQAPDLPPQELLKVILETSPEAIVVIDAEGRIREWGAAAARLTGYGRDEILGHSEGLLCLGDEQGRALGDEVGGFREATLRRRGDHQATHVQLRTEPFHDPDGRVIGTLRFIREAAGSTPADTTTADRERVLSDALRALRRSHEDLKSAQLQLIQAAKLDSIGRLAAGVAHEVKNPLAVLLIGIQLLESRFQSSDPGTAELLGSLEAAVKRANHVIIGLLDFARATTLELDVADLNQVVSDALKLVHHEMDRRHIRLEREQATDLPRLRLDRTKIEQVLVNVAMNAMDAMPEGGTLSIRTSLRQLRQPGPGIGYRTSDVLRVGQTVAVIEIEDTGTGVPPDILSKIFEPFITTKPAGKGTGLGLAVCRMIASLHRGSIWLENRPEGGTRATLCLPAGEMEKGGNV